MQKHISKLKQLAYTLSPFIHKMFLLLHSARILRFVFTPEIRDPSTNLAIERAILEAVSRGKSKDTFRLWINTRCLVVGLSRERQGLYGWYDADLAAKLGVKVYKRVTGGGAVYHDEGNLNWSFFIRRRSSAVPSITALFKEAGDIIAESLRGLGLDAYFSPPNRIECDGYKISGMAAYISRNAVLVHGTLLVSTNLDELNRLCIPPPNSPPVANIADWLGDVTLNDVAESIERTLRRLGFALRRSPLSPWEVRKARELCGSSWASRCSRHSDIIS